MGMVVRSNIMAINANRSLGMNNSQVSKNLEKLSSGFKINRAADDSAGLAISEKMKAQIKGLEQASLNSQDGISLVQTAEGALTEVHDMLNRMKELATKSGNGTIQDEVDREAIQKEVDKLNEEIDRISQSTNFNGINLLDGSLSATGGTSTVSTVTTNVTAGTIDATNGKYTSKALSAAPLVDGDKVTFSVGLDNGKSYTIDLTVKVDDKKVTTFVDGNGKVYNTVAATAGGAAATLTAANALTAVENALKDSELAKKFNITSAASKLTFEAIDGGSSAPVITSFGEIETKGGTAAPKDQAVTVAVKAEDAYSYIDTSNLTAYDGTNAKDSVFTVNGKKYVMAKTDVDVSKLDKDITVIYTAAGDLTDADDLKSMADTLSQKTGLKVEGEAAWDHDGDGGTATINALTFKPNTTGTQASGGLTLQIGDTGDNFNKVTVSVQDMSAKGIGTSGLDVSTQESANAAIDTIKNAINYVSTNRGELGALQNRLEHTINNLDVAAENMTAANSRIRDTDMAKQMMEYTKMNVLTQSAQAMLAQANQQPQSILQLLQ